MLLGLLQRHGALNLLILTPSSHAGKWNVRRRKGRHVEVKPARARGAGWQRGRHRRAVQVVEPLVPAERLPSGDWRSTCGTPCRRAARRRRRRRRSQTTMPPPRLPSDAGRMTTMAPYRMPPLQACGGSPCVRRAPGMTRTPCRRWGSGSGAGARQATPPSRVTVARRRRRRLAGTRRPAPRGTWTGSRLAPSIYHTTDPLVISL
jgi:hypothetical protein